MYSIELLSYPYADALGNLTSVPESVDGVLNVCPGNSIAITCTHNVSSGGTTGWKIQTVSAMSCEASANHITLFGGTCAPFTLNMVSSNSNDVPTVSSTAQTSDTMAADGAVVTCFAGVVGSLEVGSINITELGKIKYGHTAIRHLYISDIPVPSIQSVNQVSQYEVEVNTSVADTQCVAMYVVNTTGNYSNGGSSRTSSVTVDGLDLCRYSYSFMGYVITPGNITGEMSPPFNFTGDLSGISMYM